MLPFLELQHQVSWMVLLVITEPSRIYVVRTSNTWSAACWNWGGCTCAPRPQRASLPTLLNSVFKCENTELLTGEYWWYSLLGRHERAPGYRVLSAAVPRHLISAKWIKSKMEHPSHSHCRAAVSSSSAATHHLRWEELSQAWKGTLNLQSVLCLSSVSPSFLLDQKSGSGPAPI